MPYFMYKVLINNMPELPEVETIRRGLSEKLLDRLILKVEVKNFGVIRNGSIGFVSELEGALFSKIERRGKMLIFSIEKKQKEKNKFLLVRLGMTGQLIYFGDRDAIWGGYSFDHKGSFAYKHCHVVFHFEGGGVLLFNDIRRFGNLEIVDSEGLKRKIKSFGVEPLGEDFTVKNFSEILAGKKTNIKALLLNQKYIAGIGNIYADEALFDAGILPTRGAGSLSSIERKKLQKSIVKILSKSVEKNGTTFSDYRDSSGDTGNFKKYLKVYGRADEMCKRCKKNIIKKKVVAGRGTHFCEFCQK